jgi:hypothetical protein
MTRRGAERRQKAKEMPIPLKERQNTSGIVRQTCAYGSPAGRTKGRAARRGSPLCPQLGHARDLHVCVTTRVSGRKNLGSETKALRPAPWKTPQERLGENSRDLTDRVCRQAVVADGLGCSR